MEETILLEFCRARVQTEEFWGHATGISRRRERGEELSSSFPRKLTVEYLGTASRSRPRGS